MTRLPRLSGKQLITKLKRLGFEVVRIRGSHYLLKHPDGRTTVIPAHGKEIIGPGLLIKILDDTELDRGDLK